VQRLKNWNTQISMAMRRVVSQYSVILSGTPLENKLEELYSVMEFADNFCLGPFWKFKSECIVSDETGKVLGYKNLNKVGEMARQRLIRRTKKQVALQMPKRQDKILFVPMTKEQREQQLIYLLTLCRNMGVEVPRIALISCSEKVNPKHFPCTVEYRELVEQANTGQFGPCIVDGPLDLKTSLSPAALHKKGLTSPLEGRADGLIFSDIQAGNVFYKSITLFCQAQTAAILQGPQVPVVLTSRADAADNKFYSLALACVNS
jgi:hypothetical protein